MKLVIFHCLKATRVSSFLVKGVACLEAVHINNACVYEDLWDGRKLTMPETQIRQKEPNLVLMNISLSCLLRVFSFSLWHYLLFYAVHLWHNTEVCNTIAKLMFSLCCHVYLGSEEKKNLLLFLQHYLC